MPPSLTIAEEGDDDIETANHGSARNIHQRYSKRNLLANQVPSARIVRPMGLLHNFQRSHSHNPRTTDMVESPELPSRNKRKRKGQ